MDAPGLAVFKNLVNLPPPTSAPKWSLPAMTFLLRKKILLKSEEPVFIADKYTERGKWMDGWESRRKRELGYDRCVIKLGLPGTVKAVNIDTRHFLGNHPAFASVDAAASTPLPPATSRPSKTNFGKKFYRRSRCCVAPPIFSPSKKWVPTPTSA